MTNVPVTLTVCISFDCLWFLRQSMIINCFYDWKDLIVVRFLFQFFFWAKSAVQNTFPQCLKLVSVLNFEETKKRFFFVVVCQMLTYTQMLTYIFNCLWKKYLISEALQFSALIFPLIFFPFWTVKLPRLTWSWFSTLEIYVWYLSVPFKFDVGKKREESLRTKKICVELSLIVFTED